MEGWGLGLVDGMDWIGLGLDWVRVCTVLAFKASIAAEIGYSGFNISGSDTQMMDQTARVSSGKAQLFLYKLGVSITATRSLGDMKDGYIVRSYNPSNAHSSASIPQPKKSLTVSTRN